MADREKMNPLGSNQHSLITIPCGWYSEDMMALQYLPHLPNSMGYVSTRVIEQMWEDKFMWRLENYSEDVGYLGEEMSFVLPILMHPDTSGIAHILGMSERVISPFEIMGRYCAILYSRGDCECLAESAEVEAGESEDILIRKYQVLLYTIL